MDVKEYLQRVNEICDSVEKNGGCGSKCPLKVYGCGRPGKKQDIPKAIKMVKEFDEKKYEGICGRCERDNKELLKQEGIHYCPGCGVSLGRGVEK